MSISLPVGLQQSFQQNVDDIINNITGRACTLYYPPLQVVCPNAQTEFGNVAESYWTTGDPQHIHSQQLCDLCNGTGFISQEQSVVITMAIYWKPTQFNADFPSDYRHEEGVIQTKGFCTDLLSVLNCSRMEAFNDLGTNHYNFKLLGEPVIPGKIIPSRYFYCLWKRV